MTHRNRNQTPKTKTTIVRKVFIDRMGFQKLTEDQVFCLLWIRGGSRHGHAMECLKARGVASVSSVFELGYCTLKKRIDMED